MDSAVCAVSLSYFYQHLNDYENNSLSPKLLKVRNFLPVLNIPKRDFALKTEVQYVLEKIVNSKPGQGALIDCLTFSDDLEKNFLEKCQFMLVDHHLSPWISKTVAIYDHRPKDDLSHDSIPKDCDVNIEQVGSCATLIAELFIKNRKFINSMESMKSEQTAHDQEGTDNCTAFNNECIDHTKLHLELLQILRNAIVLDTVNFSKEAARVTDKDLNVCSHLEKYLQQGNITLEDRKTLFDDLVKARADIQQLSASQLLRKDMKILNASGVKICMPGFPITVEQYFQKYKKEAKDAIIALAKEADCNAMVLVGLYINPKDNNVNRDLAVINVGQDKDLCQVVQQQLLNLKEPDLRLESIDILDGDETFLSGYFYKQNNLRATRKHILPVVKQALENFSQRNRTTLSQDI